MVELGREDVDSCYLLQLGDVPDTSVDIDGPVRDMGSKFVVDLPPRSHALVRRGERERLPIAIKARICNQIQFLQESECPEGSDVRADFSTGRAFFDRHDRRTRYRSGCPNQMHPWAIWRRWICWIPTSVPAKWKICCARWLTVTSSKVNEGISHRRGAFRANSQESLQRRGRRPQVG
jgi:hypothetical protein